MEQQHCEDLLSPTQYQDRLQTLGIHPELTHSNRSCTVEVQSDSISFTHHLSGTTVIRSLALAFFLVFAFMLVTGYYQHKGDLFSAAKEALQIAAVLTMIAGVIIGISFFTSFRGDASKVVVNISLMRIYRSPTSYDVIEHGTAYLEIHPAQVMTGEEKMYGVSFVPKELGRHWRFRRIFTVSSGDSEANRVLLFRAPQSAITRAVTLALALRLQLQVRDAGLYCGLY